MEYADRICTCSAILCLLITPAFSQRLTTMTTSEPNIDIRLTHQESPWEGSVEVFQSGRWGTICDYQLTLPVATVICRQLGYDLALDATHTYFGSMWYAFSQIYCYGDEKTLAECYTVKDSYDYECDSGGIRCGNFSEPFDVRLADGTTPSEGRLEVHHQGIWGSVCADDFTLQEANVACQQLGYDLALEVEDPSTYGTGEVGILLNDIDCVGDEEMLSRCRITEWGSHGCGPSNDVGVRCGNIEAGEMSISLSDSYRDSGNRGNVKVFYNGNWGYICRNTGWAIEEADVACRQLGYEGGARSSYDSYVDSDPDVRFIRSYIHCIGDELNLAECDMGEQTFTSSCHWDQATVVCRSPAEGLSNGKIAGITVTCILLVMMLVVIPVIFLRCKKTKIPESPTNNGQQQTNGAASNGTTTPGQFIPSTVMYVNSPIGASQVMMPYGSPSVAYAENGQIMYPPQQPVIFQQSVSSPPQNIVSAANVDATNSTATTGLLADTGNSSSTTPQKDKIGSADSGATGTENESQENVTHDQVPLV